MDVIYAYLDDKKTLYGVFNTASEFALSHGLNPFPLGGKHIDILIKKELFLLK
jgi:hypothetical protein